MIPKRPLLYLSVPGLALVLGLIWLKRKKNIHCDTGGNLDTDNLSTGDLLTMLTEKKPVKSAKSTGATTATATLNGNVTDGKSVKQERYNSSESLPIAKMTGGGNSKRKDTTFGKSAPIDIQPNKVSPVHLTDKQIDVEILKMKILDSEYKTLTSIDEQEFIESPIDLPGSSAKPRKCYFPPLPLHNGSGSDGSNSSSGTGGGHQVIQPLIISAVFSPQISQEDLFPGSISSNNNSNSNSNSSSNCMNNVNTKNSLDLLSSANTPMLSSSSSTSISTSALKVNVDCDDIKDDINDVNNNNNINNNNINNNNINNNNNNINNDIHSNNNNTTITILTTTATTPTTLPPTTTTTATTTMITSTKDVSPPTAATSPPLSQCSYRSTDSGKGSSPPRSEGGAPSILYEFTIPQTLVGHLIGRNGTFVNHIKDKTGVNVIVRRHINETMLKICSMEGTEQDINAALAIIRKKLPLKRYPKLTLERELFISNDLPRLFTSNVENPIVLHPEQLELIESINNDVIISVIDDVGTIFMQQPLHPTFPHLNQLQVKMNETYSENTSPLLSTITNGAICVAHIDDNNWYRVQIVQNYPDTNDCLVKYVDYGGYSILLHSDLRQIKTDFMSLPFQAIETTLSNVKTIDDKHWSMEITDAIRELSEGKIIQAQVAGYSEYNIPEVLLYVCFGPDNVVFINQELVARKLLEWVE